MTKNNSSSPVHSWNSLQLHIKNERTIRRNVTTHPLTTIAHFGRHRNRPLAANLHILESALHYILFYLFTLKVLHILLLNKWINLSSRRESLRKFFYFWVLSWEMCHSSIWFIESKKKKIQGVPKSKFRLWIESYFI